MDPIFFPGFSWLIRVHARFFPMAEQKTSSLLLGTNPLHRGLSNGLEGAMRLTVYPLQLERSLSLSLFSCPHLSVWGRVIWFTFKVQYHFFTTGYFTVLPFVNEANSLHPVSTSHSSSALGVLEFINLAGLIGGTARHKSIRQRSSGFYRKHTNMTHTSNSNSSAAILLCPRRSMWVTVSHTETGLEHSRPSKPALWHFCYNIFTVWHTHTHTHTSWVSFLSLHATASNVVTIEVRVRGRWTKTLPVNCIWMDLIRWWFNFRVCRWVSCFMAWSFDDLSKKKKIYVYKKKKGWTKFLIQSQVEREDEG